MAGSSLHRDNLKAERRVALDLGDGPEDAAHKRAQNAGGRDGRLGETVGEVDDLGRAG